MSELFSSQSNLDSSAVSGNGQSAQSPGGDRILLLETLIDLAPNAIFVADANGNFIEVNARACQMLGYSQPELLGKAISDILAPEELPRLKSLEETLDQGFTDTAIWTHLHQDGSRIPSEVSFQVLPNGHRVAFVQGLRDRFQLEGDRNLAISVFQQQVQEAEAAQRTLNALMEYIPEGITIADAPDGTIRQVSRYGQQLTGRPPEVIEGVPVEQHSGTWGIYYLDGTTPVPNESLPLTRAVQQGEVVANEEFILQRSDGQQIVVLCNAGPIKNENGEVTGGVIAWRDITERKQAELALQSKEQQLQQLSNSMPQFVWITDANGEVEYVNQQWIDYSGLTLEQSRNPAQRMTYLFPGDLELVNQQWEIARKVKQPFEFEARLKRATDAAYRWFLLRAVPHLDSQGEVLRWYGTSTDIHDRKLAELNNQFLTDLDARLRQLSTVEAMEREVVSSVGEHLDVDRCLWHEINWENRSTIVEYNWRRGDVPDVTGVYTLDEYFTSEQLHYFASGQTLIVCDVTTHPSTAPYAQNYLPLGATAFVSVPCIHAGRWVAVLAVNAKAARIWQAHEVALLQEVVARLWSIIEQTRAVQALRDQEERTRLATEASQLGMWFWDIPKDELVFTDRCKALFGFPPEAQISYEVFLNVLHPDDRDRTHAAVTRALEQDVEYDIEYRTVWSNATVHWIAAKGRAFFDASGKAIRMMGTVQDISDRKQTEADLRESESRFRMLADNIAQLAWIADENGWIFWYNQRWFDYTGTTLEEMEGWGWQKVHHPDHVDRVVTHIRCCFEAGEIWEDTFPLRGQDGQYRWFLSRAIPVRDEQGNLLRWFGTSTDITQRRQILEQLRDRQERLEAALLAAGTGTFRWDIRTNTLDWDENLDRLFGLPPGETARSLDAFIQLVHPDDRQGVIDLCTRCASDGADFDMDFRVVYPDGSIHWLSDKGKTFFDENGNPAYMTGACVDITERKQTEEALKRQTVELIEASRLKDEFLAALSHELRTPLNPILGWTKLLKGQKLTSTKTNEALDVIERNVRQQIALVDDLLDISRVIQGKLNLEFHPVDLALMVIGAIETVQFAAQAKQIIINVSHHYSELEPDEGAALMVMGDGDRLRQVFWNLLSNAIKFTSDGGRVDIELSTVRNGSSHRYAQVRVTDNGIGITPEFLPYVFDRFRQADGSTTRKYGGLGLGLAIVRHIVEAHGGTVIAESPGVNQGATFVVELPLCPKASSSDIGRESLSTVKAANQLSSQSLIPTAIAPLSGSRILLVDDDLDNLELLRFILQQNGAMVTAFTSARQALQFISDNFPDLIISDIGMPEMNGYEFLQQVRQLPEARQIPALAFTAFVQQENQQKLLSSGFQSYLCKPIDPIQLLDVVAQLLGKND